MEVPVLILLFFLNIFIEYSTYLHKNVTQTGRGLKEPCEVPNR